MHVWAGSLGRSRTFIRVPCVHLHFTMGRRACDNPACCRQLYTSSSVQRRDETWKLTACLDMLLFLSRQHGHDCIYLAGVGCCGTAYLACTCELSPQNDLVCTRLAHASSSFAPAQDCAAACSGGMRAALFGCLLLLAAASNWVMQCSAAAAGLPWTTTAQHADEPGWNTESQGQQVQLRAGEGCPPLAPLMHEIEHAIFTSHSSAHLLTFDPQLKAELPGPAHSTAIVLGASSPATSYHMTVYHWLPAGAMSGWHDWSDGSSTSRDLLGHHPASGNRPPPAPSGKQTAITCKFIKAFSTDRGSAAGSPDQWYHKPTSPCMNLVRCNCSKGQRTHMQCRCSW